MKRSLESVACLVVVCLLAGCGFHLRRAVQLPPQMHAFYITGGSTDLNRNLRRNLASDSITIVDDPTRANAILNISQASRSKALLAVNSLGLPIEYRLTYTVQFSLMVGNAVLIEPQTIALSRTYNYNIQDAIGNEEQEQALYYDMQTDIAQLIVFRIQAAAKNAMPPEVAPTKATVAAPVAATSSSH